MIEKPDEAISWLMNNKEWVFSGIGLAVVALAWKVLFWLIKPKEAQSTGGVIRQSGGIFSKNTQVVIQKNTSDKGSQAGE